MLRKSSVPLILFLTCLVSMMLSGGKALLQLHGVYCKRISSFSPRMEYGVAMFCHQAEKTSDHAPTSRGVDANGKSNIEDINQHRLSVAPMMEYTDIHFRTLLRMITKEAVLYTEMITTNTLVRTQDPERFLESNFNIEDPIVLQLGGSSPSDMKTASAMARKLGFQEININAGCPSEKVSGAGCFGAALMLQPDLLAELALSVGEGLGRPATVKCRIGVDDEDSYEGLREFIRLVSEKGQVNHFIVHARKAVLNGNFSPAMNRKIPVLKYNFVHDLIRDFPHLKFTINGGINTMEEVQSQLALGCHGVMVGRAFVNSPFDWRSADSILYDKENSDLNRREVLQQYAEYARGVETAVGKKARTSLVKPILQIFSGEQNGRFFRRNIDTLLRNKEVLVADLIQEAAECMTEDVMDRRASSPPPVYVPYVPQTSESNTAIFKENEKFNAELAANSC